MLLVVGKGMPKVQQKFFRKYALSIIN